MEEIWKPVVGYEGWYEVSNLGRIKRIAPGRNNSRINYIHRPWLVCGYPMVELCRHGEHVPRAVHVIVAQAFIGPCPEGNEVDHIDGNRANPSPENLEYVTHGENMLRARARLGDYSKRGEDNGNSRLTVDMVRQIREMGKTTIQTEVARAFGVSQSTVWRVLHRKIWTHI